MEQHTEDANAEEESTRLSVCHPSCAGSNSDPLLQVKIAVYASLYSNLALCVLQRMFLPSSLDTCLTRLILPSLRCHLFGITFSGCYSDRLRVRYRQQLHAMVAP
jgi:hypothetical protein